MIPDWGSFRGHFDRVIWDHFDRGHFDRVIRKSEICFLGSFGVISTGVTSMGSSEVI